MSIVEKSTQPYSGFTPTSIPGCLVWLDAADTSTLTLSGSSVTQWRDKSGNGYHAAPGTSPTYNSSSRYIVFNGSNQFLMLPNGAYPYGNSAYSFFIIAYTTNTGNPQWLIAGGAESQGSLLGILFYSTNAIWHSWWLTEYQLHNVVTNNTPVLVNASYNGTNRKIIANGGTTATDTPGARNSGSGNNYIGRRGGGQYLGGGIGEMIVFDSEIVTSQRQQIEGYLMWKWGLGASLAMGHPNKYSIATRPFQPVDITGCQLWLDAADRRSITLSGSNVTQWNDKSGNGRNATPYDTGYPAYSSNGWNGSLPTMTFGTAASFTSSIPAGTFSSGVTMFIVWYRTDASAPAEAVLWRATSAPYPGPWGMLTETYPARYIGNGPSQGFSALRSSTIPTSLNNPRVTSIVLNGTMAWSEWANGTSYTFTSFYTQNTQAYVDTENSVVIGVRPDKNTGAQLKGNISEVILFQGALPTAQRQQVENYLMAKWRVNLPRAFTPADVTTCALWLDGGDVSSIDLSGNSVTQWRDKSGNGRHAAPTVSPTWAGDGITFDGTSYMRASNTASLLSNASYSMFIVEKATGGTSGIDCVVGDIGQQGGNAGFLLGYVYNLTWFRYGYWANDVDYTGLSGTGQLRMWSFNHPTTGNRSFNLYGTTVGTGTSQKLTAFQQLGIGGFGAGGYRGKIYEIICYTSGLTTAQISQAEGYLAWKWGLQGSLPAGHTFKSTPPAFIPTTFKTIPMTPLFAPTALSGCALWLDAADPTTFTLSTNTISQWRDKSGAGNNGTPITVGPTLVSNALNGLPGVTFPSAANLLLCGTLLTGTNFSMIAVIKYSPTAGNQQRAVGQWKRYYNSGMQFTQGQAFLIQAGQSEQFTIGPTSGADTASTHIYSASLNSSTSSSAATLFAGVDGDTSTYTNSSGPNVATAVTQFAVGGLYEGGSAYYPVKGYIHEVIVYTQTLSIAQLAQLEGYLAWKWGLQNVLPSKHPYSKFRP